MILTQSPDTDAMFAGLGCRTRPLTGGVDMDKFRPVSVEEKRELRVKHGLDGHRYIALHVGPVKRGRNLLLLRRIQQEQGIQVLIVATPSVPMESEVMKMLLEAGCIVWRKYVADIAEIYSLSDCYVFPTVDRTNCIELPLSILEAMACDVKVVSTPFGGLPHVFSPGEGLAMAANEDAMVELVGQMAREEGSPGNRERVQSFSWESIGEQLDKIYLEMAG